MSELDKMLSVKQEGQIIGDFLSFLFESGYSIGFYYNNELVDKRNTIEQWLAEYYDIDLDEAEKEKLNLLNSLGGYIIKD